MSETRVTYYLGAGASADAIPMVSQIRHFYEPFFKFVEKEFTKISFAESSHILNNFSELTKKLVEHHTPDTLAKKFWLRKEHKNLNLLKIYLSLFFYWIENEYSPSSTFVSDVKLAQGGLDDRYDPFLATLLERGDFNVKMKFPRNINILTWNYDTQIETAYSNFVGKINYDGIRNGLCIIPKPFDHGQDYPIDSSKLVKLNGCSRLIFSDKGLQIISPFESPDSQEISSGWIREFANSVRSIRKNSSEPLINFAWETDNPASQEALKEAREIFSKTDILVIIGYSFPTFNRSVDKDLMSFLPKHCRIYYQAPEEHVGDLIEKFKAICKVGNVHPVKNTDQFHIPFEL